MRKILGSVVVAGLAVALAAGPAFAHECYNASRATKGNTSIAEHSPAFMTFNDVVYGFLTSTEEGGPGLCPAGAQWLVDQIDANATTIGVDTTWVVSNRTVQAQGIDHSPSAQAQSNLSNGTGIDHLGENAGLLQFIFDNIGTAFGQCV